MSAEMDLKDIWARQSIGVAPLQQEIKAKSLRVRQAIRKRAILTMLALTGTMILMATVMIYDKPRLLSTYIGLGLMFMGLVAHIIGSGGLLTLVLRRENDTDSVKAQLEALIRIRKRQRFLLGQIFTLYFILLTSGLMLYMVEYTLKLSLFQSMLWYTLTLFWMGYNWFYVGPKRNRRQQRGLNEVIEQFTLIDRQLSGESEC